MVIHAVANENKGTVSKQFICDSCGNTQSLIQSLALLNALRVPIDWKGVTPVPRGWLYHATDKDREHTHLCPTCAKMRDTPATELLRSIISKLKPAAVLSGSTVIPEDVQKMQAELQRRFNEVGI